MARSNLFYYLFAVLVVLAVVANARPTSPQPDTGNVGAMPGMATALKGGAQDNDNAPKDVMADKEAAYEEDMEKALEAASKAAAKATPTVAGLRPTPGVPTTAPSQTSAKPQPAAQASPSESASAKPKSMLSNLPLVGSLVEGLPLPI
ncbi:hypothetical protein UA08_05724 [Talaromyces atroroseus]|uniref:Uncharacterized protein n=1 Tax=Talaromyces atroroseus TaxID=1441469 RepID=A0A225ACE1_TALAT|nr:hypothetical protein UA08_05724 [Talaromyces atroroseus]OKL58791.1 hypothetical protein UA08_05724 [Talaromyces atroroseus]